MGHGHKCVSVFQASTAVVPVTQTDVVTNQWTILRNLELIFLKRTSLHQLKRRLVME